MLARSVRGVTLIELIIGIAVLAILLALGIPAFTQALQNARLRATADSFTAGLQLARAEAIKRNGRVELLITNDDPVATMVDAATASATGVTTGMNWIVRYINPTTGFHDFVEGKSSLEGAPASDTTVTVNATNTTITFNAFGATTLGAAATFQFENPPGGACVAASGPMRCLNIVVTPGGQIKMCDPSISTMGDTRKC